MAKKKSEEVVSKVNLKELAGEFLKISKTVNKELTKYASTLDSSIYSNIDEYIDTGSYALNRLITGDMYKGIPRGRVVALAGQSGVGKSFVCGMTIKNAQDMGYLVVLYDSENAINSEFFANIGVRTDMMIHVPIDVIEDFRNHVTNTCESYFEKNPDTKIMIILDSFGNLSCAKEKRDMLAGKDNSDMGTRAKAGKSMLKEITKFCGKYRVPFVFTNHSYKDVASAPNPMYAKEIQSGGNQATYMASAVIMLRKRVEKDATTKQKTGSILTCRSDKNRLCKDEQKVEMYLSFETGPNRYYGLLQDAIEAGIFEEVNKKNYIIKETGEKVPVAKLYNKRIFTKERLDIINEYCKKSYMYPKVTSSDDEDIILDVEEMEDE